MKRIFSLLTTITLMVIIISSCSSKETYAQQLKAEKATIAAYIQRNNINILSSFPANKKWGEKDYVLIESSGLYFHLADSGDVESGDTLELHDQVVPRYKEFTLDEVSIIKTNFWSTLEYPHPPSFEYGATGESCPAFHEAASYMKRNNSRAFLIIPSKIGFYASSTTDATPYGYEIKIKIQK